MTLDAETALARLLQQGSPAGVWFLHGDAVRLRDEGARRVVDAALDPATRDFNFDSFSGDRATPEDLAATIAMPPMMAEARVVLVRDAHRLTPKARKVLLGVVENPPPDLALVVTATIPKGSKAAFYRTLAKRSRSLEWKTPRTNEIPGWLMARARDHHDIVLTREAAQALASAVAEDLSLLDAELEKLASLGEDGPISVGRVRELIPTTKRIDRWSWLDLVTNREYARALRELDDVLTSDRGVPLVAALVESLLFVGIAVQGGAPRVKRALVESGRGNLAWKANVYARQARRWSAPEIRAALRHLKRADSQLKSGGKDAGVLTDLLLALGQLEERVA